MRGGAERCRRFIELSRNLAACAAFAGYEAGWTGLLLSFAQLDRIALQRRLDELGAADTHATAAR
jgi:hypothetical protein